MPFIPAEKMWERVKVAREESDTALFLHLLYCGEMVTKLVTAGLVAAVVDDGGQQYRQVHRLVRADGLGEWVQVIDDVLTGPAAQYLLAEASEERRELTQRCGVGTWQYEATRLVHHCLRIVEPQYEALPTKVALRSWFAFFAELRNKTRGHGAPSGGDLSRMCADLEKSLHLLLDHHCLFQRPWAYLHQNLSGKYRVTKLTEDSTPFDPLRSTRTATFPDAVYIVLANPSRWSYSPLM